MDATDVMDSLRVDILKSIAKQAGIPRSITRKTELIEALNRFVTTDPAEFFDRLGPIERNLLAEAIHNDNRVRPVVFSAKYKVACPRPHPSGKNGSLVHMVITTDRYSSEIEVPKTIADVLRPLVPKPASPKPASVEHIPDTLDLTDEQGRANPTDIRPIHVFSGERTVFFELRRMLQLRQGMRSAEERPSDPRHPTSHGCLAGGAGL